MTLEVVTIGTRSPAFADWRALLAAVICPEAAAMQNCLKFTNGRVRGRTPAYRFLTVRRLSASDPDVAMVRYRLAGAVLLAVVGLPGCGLFNPDRPGLCGRRCRQAEVAALPAAYPVVSDPVICGGPVIPPPSGGMIPGPPVLPPQGPIQTETFPPPSRIPKAGIEENRGKQFELDPAGRSSGPVLSIPAAATRP